MTNCPYLWLIPLLPLIGATLNGVFGYHLHRRFGEMANALIGVTLPWISFALSLAAFFQLKSLPAGGVLLDHC